jgi:CheY-like chemotaxis protein
VVDDSPVNRSLIRSTLEPSGYEVVVARTSEEALEVARRASFDLILSDLHMPGQSGLEFLGRVKADPQLRSIPFILFTASSSGRIGGARERAMALGADVFISRPIEPQALLSTIEACLQEASRK